MRAAQSAQARRREQSVVVLSASAFLPARGSRAQSAQDAASSLKRRIATSFAGNDFAAEMAPCRTAALLCALSLFIVAMARTLDDNAPADADRVTSLPGVPSHVYCETVASSL